MAELSCRVSETGDPLIDEVRTTVFVCGWQADCRKNLCQPLGQVGIDWQFVGLGRFFGNDTTDMLLRSASTGGFEVYDISNDQITGEASLGAVGLDFQGAGFGDVNRGETFTAAPLVVKNKVIVGNSGGELGVRGYVVALDVRSGAELWRAYNTGSDADVKIALKRVACPP